MRRGAKGGPILPAVAATMPGMFFASPWWLLGLVPWAVVSIWLLWGRRKRTMVPFVELWRMPPEVQATRRSLQMPLPIAACIGAMGLAILAAAGPAFLRSQVQGSRITIIVDRGVTMSARGRYEKLIGEASWEVADRFGPGPVELILVPGGSIQTDRGQWPHKALSFPPTAMDTRGAIEAAVADHLSRDSSPVLVLTDQEVRGKEGRVVRIEPEDAVADVAITGFAAREAPSAQVMVRVRNDSGRGRAGLRIIADGKVVAQREIELPARGEERSYFVDAPLGRLISAELEVEDDLAVNNRAYLVRQGLWPKVEPRTPLPSAVQRLLEEYSVLRPAGSDSPRIALVSSLDALPVNEAGAVVASQGELKSLGKLTVVDHPLTRHVTAWPERGLPLRDPTWTPIVYAGGEALVAVRTSPVRQAYVGLDLSEWSRSPGFVIFMANLLDWLGVGKQDFAATAPRALPSEWAAVEAVGVPSNVAPGLWPGIYRDGDGRLMAVNAPDVRLGRGGGDWHGDLERAARLQAHERPVFGLGGPLILLSLGCIGLAAATWRRHPGKGPLRVAGVMVEVAKAD